MIEILNFIGAIDAKILLAQDSDAIFVLDQDSDALKFLVSDMNAILNF